jgi:Mce-associated membrane protein
MTSEETPVVEDTADVKEKADIQERDAKETAIVDDDSRQPGRLKRFTGLKKRSSGRLLPAFVVLLVVASISLVGGVFYFSYLPHRDTDAAAAKSAVTAASEGAVAILSYSPDSLERDFSSARSHLTGDFLSYYDQFTQQIVAPAAKQKAVKTTAVVLRAALSEFHPDSAIALLFVNQSSQSKDRPEPTLSSSSVIVKLTKADGKWLISSFDPV